MSYRQYKTGFKKSLWEQEEFNKPYSDESKYNQAMCSTRSGHSMSDQRQLSNYMVQPRWTNKIAEFYSYNRAIAIDGGYSRNTIPGKLLDKGCKSGGYGYDIFGKIGRKEGHTMIVGAKIDGPEKTMNLRGQKRILVGNLASHGYSSCSDNDPYSESDSDSD